MAFSQVVIAGQACRTKASCLSVQVYERKVHCLSNYNIEEPQPPWSIAAGCASLLLKCPKHDATFKAYTVL